MTDLDLEAIKARREGVPHASQWGLYKTVVPYDEEYDLPERPIVELNMMDSTSEEADRTFDFLAEITWDVDALIEEVERLRERPRITDDMKVRAHQAAVKSRLANPERSKKAWKGVYRAETDAALNAALEETESQRGALADVTADLDYAEWKHAETLEHLTTTDDMVERAALAIAGVNEWPTNEELGGNPFTGTRDDEFRDEYIEMARAALEAALGED